jgi:hypothetical protein
MRHAAIPSKLGVALASGAILALAATVALVLGRADKAAAYPLGPAEIVLQSGVDTVGYAISGGGSGTAAVYSQNQAVHGGSGDRCHSAWASSIAGTAWIGVSPDCTDTTAVGSLGEPQVTQYSVAFELPPGSLDPAVSVSLHADNVASVLLNGTEIGAQPDCSEGCPTSNFQGDPEVFTTSAAESFELGTDRLAGANTLVFSVADEGVVTGLDFKAVVTFTQGPAALDHFDIDPIDDPQTAGVPFDVTVTAIDVNGNVKTDYEGGATFVDTLPDAPDGTEPAYGELSFTDGVATTTVTAFDATDGEDQVSLSVEDPDGDFTESGVSNSFGVLPSDPENVVFGQQPTRTLVDTVIAPAPTVIVRDTYHNVATQATDPVSMAIGSNPGLGSVLGTTSQAPVAGVASFGDLSITESGGGYTLVASTAVTGGTASATSDPFDVPNTIVECGTGGCSATATSATTTVQVTVPAQSGSAARALAGAGADDDIAIAIDAAAGSFACAGPAAPAIGSISTIDPPAGYTSANPIKVQVVYERIVPRNGGVSKFVLCKDSGFGTPFAVVPKCAKKKPVAPCELHRNAVGRAGLKFDLLITSVDPRLASR